MDIANLGSLITTGSSLITSGSTKLLDGIKAGAEMLSFRPQFIDVGDLKLVTTSLVAEGGYSFVYTAREVMPGSEQGRLFALKKVIAQEAEVLEIARVEMNLLRTLPRHPNIIDYHGSTLENKGRGVTEMYMALEYCANGSLVDLVMPGMPSLSEEKLLSVFHPVCKAVAHLHAQNPPITHRDLKLENVLCSSSGVYKLCDFGSATTRRVKIKTSAERQREAETISKFSTLMYRAPEMVDLYQGHEISEKVDVWALGCILYTLAFHKHPFDAGTELQIINARFNIPQSSPYGEEVHNLMRYALQPDPAKRPTVEELIAKVAQRRGVGMDAEINLADSHQLPRDAGRGSKRGSVDFASAFADTPRERTGSIDFASAFESMPQASSSSGGVERGSKRASIDFAAAFADQGQAPGGGANGEQITPAWDAFGETSGAPAVPSTGTHGVGTMSSLFSGTSLASPQPPHQAAIDGRGRATFGSDFDDFIHRHVPALPPANGAGIGDTSREQESAFGDFSSAAGHWPAASPAVGTGNALGDLFSINHPEPAQQHGAGSGQAWNAGPAQTTGNASGDLFDAFQHAVQPTVAGSSAAGGPSPSSLI
mmetsp:Transcript_9055/g.21940  ORF Transcript_9055/g.21940 Transcript_9055/m.21940 type:complete len:597 (+) Transcript_9055:36-1826(+)